jgi:cell division protein FtsI (penicillin-binding protein 3)
MSRPPAEIDRSQRLNGTIVLVLICALLMGLGARLVHIHSGHGPELVASLQNQRKGRSMVPARRGMILDVRGRVVAANRRMADVFVDAALVNDVEELAQALGARLGLDSAEIARRINQRRSSRYVVVAREVGEVEAEAIRKLGVPAVGLSDRAVRTYPLGTSMAHVLGFVGRDGRGLEGLELALEKHLAGRDGVRATIRDARRRALRPLDQKSTPPIDGGHLVLTLDAEIQRVVEVTLERTRQAFEAVGAVAIVMSPKTGDVLALACSPAFDPASAANIPEAIRRNRAVTDPVEPGSTFKPFIVSGALNGGVVTLTDKIDCRGGTFRVGGRTICDVSPHGVMTVAEVVTRSSNIGMAVIGQRMGPQSLHDAMRRFGFGERTGIECPGEARGVVYPLDRWTSYSVTSVPMGYEIGITPIQLITGFCAIVNDGLLLRPRLVRDLLAPDGTTIESFAEPEVVRRILPTNIARRMSREVLVSVVEEGSGRRAKLAHYASLGKTGTAKLTYTDRPGYEPGAYLSSFIGAAPARDPEVVVLVMVRRPNAKLGYYGGTVSGPAVKTILEETLAYLQVPPDEKVVILAER